MKYNKREGGSTPAFYLAKQTKQGDLWFTEDPTQIDYSKYQERLQTAIKAILIVRGYSKEQIKDLVGLTPRPQVSKKNKKKLRSNTATLPLIL